MKSMKQVYIATAAVLGIVLLGACTQASQAWPTEKDLAPLLQQSLQMSVGSSFDGSRTKVTKVEVSGIKCNDLDKGRVGCSYRAKATLQKLSRGATTPEVTVFEETSSGTFVRRGDLWARGQ